MELVDYFYQNENLINKLEISVLTFDLTGFVRHLPAKRKLHHEVMHHQVASFLSKESRMPLPEQLSSESCNTVNIVATTVCAVCKMMAPAQFHEKKMKYYKKNETKLKHLPKDQHRYTIFLFSCLKNWSIW